MRISGFVVAAVVGLTITVYSCTNEQEILGHGAVEGHNWALGGPSGVPDPDAGLPSAPSGNRPPTAPVVSVDPGTLEANDELHCQITTESTDPDGDGVSYSISWDVDGAPFAGSTTVHPGDTIAHNLTGHSEAWSCQATPSDGWVDGPTVTSAPATTGAPLGGNILLIIMDDVGTDNVAVYGEVTGTPPTPNMDALAAQGVLFRNAYSTPTCSSTRGTMLSGRHGRRYGVGQFINSNLDSWEIPLDVLSVPEMLGLSGFFTYDHSLVGKWHLTSCISATGMLHAVMTGWNWSAGALANLGKTCTGVSAPRDYYHFEKIVNGVATEAFTYATTDTADDAIARIGSMTGPWFLWLAFNAAHAPFNAPPLALQTQGVTDADPSALRFDAMVEALDTEMGRVFAAVDLDTTTVIVLGDNGTPGQVVTAPRDPTRAKGTVYEGGVNVPFIVAGQGVPLAARGSESAALVHTSDVFATTADIAGVALRDLTEPSSTNALTIDGQTLLPYLRDPATPSRRQYAYSEEFAANGPGGYVHDERAVRDVRYKLIRLTGGAEEFYDLQGLHDDGPNLLLGTMTSAEILARQRLSDELDRITAELTYDGF